MTRTAHTTRTVKSIAAAALAALALAAAAGAADDKAAPSPGIQPVGGITAGTGCSLSCIVSALVTPTASSASVTVKTSVPTSTTVTVSEQGVPLGLAAAPTPKHISVPTFALQRTVAFAGLRPDTAYRIVVSSRDAQGRVDTRTGTFRTRTVKVAVSQPDLGLGTTVSCAADCIASATAAAHASEAGRVDLAIRTTVPARLQLDVYRRVGDVLELERTVTSSNGVRSWSPVLRGLRTGTTFDVSLTATDGQARARREWGKLATARAVAIVAFHKHTVLADGEIGDGEVSFDYHVEDEHAGGTGFRKIGSGETVAAIGWGTSRPTVTLRTSIDGHRDLDVYVRGVECDALLMKNCLVEAGRYTTERYAGDTYLTTRAAYRLEDLLDGSGALPPGYGTGLPAGHDAYLVWEGSYDGFRFRTYATVDFEVVS